MKGKKKFIYEDMKSGTIVLAASMEDARMILRKKHDIVFSRHMSKFRLNNISNDFQNDRENNREEESATRPPYEGL
jgi:hypothetical protein